MSQNQSFFWHTTSRNVYLKRSAKLHMFLALIAVLTYSTICCAEINGKNSNDNDLLMGAPPVVMREELPLERGLDTPNAAVNNDVAEKEKSSQSGFVDAFTASISVILFTELGDKTFFIAAIMAMRHPRLIVFSGAIMALALMTVLSVVFGMAAQIIPKVYTYYISTALFAIFGLKMIYEGYMMKPSDAQEELEEVQSDLRKREDELMRSKHSKYEESDVKRKNSNSDKEDVESGSDINSGSVGVGTGNGNVKTASPVNVQNPEMEHRQRKQRSNQTSNNNNNNNNISNNKNSKANTNKTDCDLNSAATTATMKNNASDTNDSGNECDESDVFLDGNGSGGAADAIKMNTFHSSPALSSIASNQTNQTNCDEYPNSPIIGNGVVGGTPTSNKRRLNGNNNNNTGEGNHTAMIHSNSAGATLSKSTSKHSINSISGISTKSAADAAAGQQIGGSMNRLERDVTATTIQDPESGVTKRPPKRGAAYLTTRVFMQAFTMTFLAEWGDRSQLTTIILAASKNVYGVIAGGVIGHSICTGLAVIGGRMVAAKISVRTVTIVGGVVFLGFALYALIVRPDDI